MSDFGKDKNKEEALTENNIQSTSSKFGYPLKTKQRERVYLNSNDGTNNLIKSKFPLKNILYIIITIILFLTTIFGCLFGILFKNEPQAIKTENISADKYLGGKGSDLFFDTSTINRAVFNDLLNKMGGDIGYTGAHIKNKGYIIQINGILWQVVYRSKDYVTLWLADSYLQNGEQYVCQYSSSYLDYEALPKTDQLRVKLNETVYQGLFGSYQSLANGIIATPHDLYASGITWQSHLADISWSYDKIYTLGSQLGSGGEDTAAYDKIWLPAAHELFGSSDGAGGHIGTGIWGLNQTELMFQTTTNEYWCLLRSRYFENTSQHTRRWICVADYNGLSGANSLSSSSGVRPAFHLNLANAANKAGNYVAFNGLNSNQFPSLNFFQKYNEPSKTYSLQASKNYQVTSITDNYNNSLNVNGSGSTPYYSYTSSTDTNSGITYLTITNPNKHLTFSIGTTQTINIFNNNSSLIVNVSSARILTNSTTATLSAEYLNNTKPMISILGSVTELTSVRGKGNLGVVNYNFTFINFILTINFLNIPNGTFNVTIDTVNKNSSIFITSDMSSVTELYDNSGNAQIIVRPNTGYWVNSFVIDGRTYKVEYRDYVLSDVPNAFKVYYSASEIDNMFKLKFETLKNNINMIINCSTTPLTDLKESGGATIDGVAVNTTLGGDAKIIANDLNNTDGGFVTLVAWVNAGYSFAGWSTDGGATYLTDAAGVKYGASASIPADQVKGKVVTAIFIQNSNNNINTDTSEGGLL